MGCAPCRRLVAALGAPGVIGEIGIGERFFPWESVGGSEENGVRSVAVADALLVDRINEIGYRLLFGRNLGNLFEAAFGKVMAVGST